MKSWRLGFGITVIYLALSGVGVQAKTDPTVLMEDFEAELKIFSASAAKMAEFDADVAKRREQDGEEFDEDRHQSEWDLEVRRDYLDKTRSVIEEEFQRQRDELESSPPSLAWEAFTKSEENFYKWLQEQYDWLQEQYDALTPNTTSLRLGADRGGEELGTVHKRGDLYGDIDGEAYNVGDEDQSTRTDSTFLIDYDTLGNAVGNAKIQKEKMWFNDRLIWPVVGGKEILNTSFMFPSWTGISGHTYPGHTGIDIGYFVRDENGEPWTKDKYEADKSDFGSVIAAKGGEVVFANNQEGDACGHWLLTKAEVDSLVKGEKNPTDVEYENSTDCGGGCAHGNCAGNYIVIDHDPDASSGLLNRAGYRYTAYYHLQKGGVLEVGDKVAAGDVIGRIGSSGQSLTPHLHFEVHKEAMNPENHDWELYKQSLVDPFYSAHSSNTWPEGSSKWRNQCYRDTETMYGLVTGSYFPQPRGVPGLELDATLEMPGEIWRMCGMMPDPRPLHSP